MEQLSIGLAWARYHLHQQANGRSEHTLRQAKRHIWLLKSYLREHHVGEITDEDIARFFTSRLATCRRDGRAKKATSLNCLRSSIRSFFGYLCRVRVIERDPAMMLRLARAGVAPPRGISAEEREKLFAVMAAEQSRAARRDEVLFGLLLGSGIRIGSALALDVGDVDAEDGSLLLRTVKGGRPQRAFAPREVMARLVAHVGGRVSGAVFLGQGERRLGQRQAHRRLRMWCRRAGIPRAISPHHLRHAFALGLYERTGDVMLVQAALGHRSILSTTVYAAASTERVRKAVSGGCPPGPPLVTRYDTHAPRLGRT